MSIKNKFSSIVVAKRIVYACINLSVAIFIISIITVFLALFTKIDSALLIYPSPDYSKLISDYFFKVVFPPMFISSIFGIILFTLINHILSRRLKKIKSVYFKKKLINNEDIFKLHRALKSKSKYPIMKDYWQSPGNPII